MTWLTRFFRSEAPEPGVPSVHSVTFDTRGWLPRKTTGNTLRWSNPDGDTLSSRIDSQLARDALPLMDLDALRARHPRCSGAPVAWTCAGVSSQVPRC
jgi:hypothetical protein